MKKCRGGPLEKKTSEKKCLAVPKKKLEGGPFGVAWYGMLRGKTGKPFWSSSLSQMVQFDTIIFGRTFKNYFGQFVWIEKKPL